MRYRRRLVIDADIAQAAGGIDASDRFSQTCHDLLEEVAQLKHFLVMSDAIDDEWSRHASRFAHRWRVEMVRRRRVWDLGELAEDKELRRSLGEWGDDDNRVDSVLKDVHLIKATFAAGDRIIISGDVRAAKLFNEAAAVVRALRKVAWINARSGVESPLIWLDRGAKRNEAPLLGTKTGTLGNKNRDIVLCCPNGRQRGGEFGCKARAVRHSACPQLPAIAARDP